MGKTVEIRVPVDAELKASAEKIFRRLGLTTTQVINLFFRQIVLHRGLPFPLRLPTFLALGKPPRKYPVVVAYSDEDEGYIATVPELPGCSAFGATEAEAMKEIKVAASLWIAAAKKARRSVPKPKA